MTDPPASNLPAPSATPRYAAAGVDIAANDRLIPRYRALAQSAGRPEVLGGVGVFSGLFDLTAFPNPVLVASTDGVGTKVLVARRLGRFDSVGQDIVNHCINDILTAGAQPLFFLDYLAGSGLSEDEKVAIVGGIAKACAQGGLALLGGETADMPGLYQHGDFDLAGTIIGVVEKGHTIDGRDIRPGDILLGLPSNGLHTNGYTLARAVLRLDDAPPAHLAAHDHELGTSLADALLAPHTPYWPLLAPVLDRCKGIAHITGGGIPGNVARILPPDCAAHLQTGSWPEPPIFERIRARGEIDEEEMIRVFNVGLGLVIAVQAAHADSVRAALPGATVVGQIRDRADGPAVHVEPA
ncbi:MAG: phosphoribosylformylglycinamidine cyclo-ligase [Chloroflexi bacterium]|nr:MAG: phosphoribosylformylglycinamidine cyclo-ligase [Chloroflexota bacterium]